jgi:hypothetical protein
LTEYSLGQGKVKGFVPYFLASWDRSDSEKSFINVLADYECSPLAAGAFSFPLMFNFYKQAWKEQSEHELTKINRFRSEH